jgi:mannosylglycerate hydrolase
MNAPLVGIVVSHTHWDRAWYLPFQSYRVRLVALVDELLALLETAPEYRCYTFDGQSVLLEDYLAVRPENRERLAALVTNGRLRIGPWYTLPDLFLEGGEAVVRNLQIGLELCEHFGGASKVGYIPDPFGHFAQLPQVLKGFGIDNCIFMRGMEGIERERCGTIFRWEAPNGDGILAVYQVQGYLSCGALGHPAVFGRFEGHVPTLELATARVNEAIEAQTPLQRERTLLLANGCDHMPPQPELPRLIEALNKTQSKIELRHGSLDEFVMAIRAEGLSHQTVRGDLLGNCDHPILLSVYSTRTYLKEHNHRAQSLLARVAEPLALFSERDSSTTSAPLLREAWKLLLKNHAHDDICGCSVDAVHREDEVRFAEVEQIAEALAVQACEVLVRRGIAAPAVSGTLASDLMIFNPHPFPVTTRVQASVLFPNPGGEWAAPTPERQLAAVDDAGNPVALRKLGTTARTVRSAFLETTWGRRYDVEAEVTLPSLGYSVVHVFEQADAVPARKPSSGRPSLESARYRIELEGFELLLTDKTTGDVRRDWLRFEYQLDGGDSYSFGPVLNGTNWFGRFSAARTGDDSPDTLHVLAKLTAPVGWNREAKAPENDATMMIGVAVRIVESPEPCGDAHIDLAIEYENLWNNGRLRVFVALETANDDVWAETPFLLSKRDLVAPTEPVRTPYPGERSYPTHYFGNYLLMGDEQNRRWIATRGLHECEVIRREGFSGLAVTLHRAVGLLSVFGGAIRTCQAGPEVATPEAQCHRRMRHHIGIGLARQPVPQAIRAATLFSHPVWVREMPYLPHCPQKGPVPRRASWLSLSNGWIVLSACRGAANASGKIALRLVNLSETRQSTAVALGFEARRFCVTSLMERWDEVAAAQLSNRIIELTLEGHEIKTILVEP